jgi:hypothetical protein
MATWLKQLLEALRQQQGLQDYWKQRIDPLLQPCKHLNNVHLAVFVQPFLQYLLEGRKTVESRFSVHRCPPFRRVRPGDLVLIKQSGGPIVALAEVSHVWFYEMDSNARDFIRSKFSDQLCIDDAEFWDSKSGACYATLMQFSRIEKLDHVSCMKKDRRGWVVLTESREQPSLFSEPES